MVFIVGDTRGGVLLSRLEEMAGGLGRTVSVSRSRAQGGRSPRLRIQESPGKAARAWSRGQLSPSGAALESDWVTGKAGQDTPALAQFENR